MTFLFVSLPGGLTVTDARMVHVGEFARLRTLHLDRSFVSDSGLAHLNDLSKVDLTLTRVTDAGLVHLKGTINLKQLSVLATRVTDSGMKELKRALPSLTISD